MIANTGYLLAWISYRAFQNVGCQDEVITTLPIGENSNVIPTKPNFIMKQNRNGSNQANQTLNIRYIKYISCKRELSLNINEKTVILLPTIHQ